MNMIKRKILVVDDDPIVIRIVGSTLRGQGYEVITATDGLDAMVLVKQQEPDLIVLDIMMPEINGYDVCHHIKFSSEYKHIPIIILTSREQELDPRIGEMIGIEYLQKPLNRDQLLDKMDKMLGKEPSADGNT